MTDVVKHECGIAMIRLLKPLDYYYDKYGSWQYGLDKLYLLMEKQHNRGQEGAGLAAVKLEASAGNEFIFRERATGSGAIDDIFGKVHETFHQFAPEKLNDIDFVKKKRPFCSRAFPRASPIQHYRKKRSGIFASPIATKQLGVKKSCTCRKFQYDQRR
jgi:amidophosphoribosyltransferase